MGAEPVLLAWADSRAHVGVGHAVRSFALAQAWADHGGRAVLVVPELTATVRALTEDPGVERRVIPVAESPFDERGGAAFADLAAAAGASWVSIDSYETVAAAQRAVRDRGVRVLVIDDHGIAAPYDADLLVDQNLDAETRATRDLGTVDARCLGVRHALLRRSFRTAVAAAADPAVGGAVGAAPTRSRVVITLGGNPSPEVEALGREVAARVASRTPVDLLIGRVGAAASTDAGVTVHEVVPDASAIFAGAAVALSTAGSTAWELCASRCASVLVAVAPNQIPVGDALARRGAACFAGRLEAARPRQLAARVLALLDAPETRDELAGRAGALVDGQGASRVVAAMRAQDLRLRPATSADVRRYFDWANEPAVRAASFTTAPIAWDGHVAWFEDRLRRADCRLFVAEDVDGAPVGQIRFDAADHDHDHDHDSGPGAGDVHTAEVGVSLDAAARGRGLGAPIIVAGVRALTATWPDLALVRAEVRATNPASARAFVTAGFVHEARLVRDGIEIDRYVFETVAPA